MSSPSLSITDPARVTIVTAPAVEPWLVSDAEVDHHVKRDSSEDDAYVTALISAARRHIERLTGLSLVNQTLKATYDRLPSVAGVTAREIDLPRAPLVSIGAVTYLDQNGAAATFSADNYSAVNAGCAGAFGRLALKPSADWPDLGDYRGALSVEFTAGFGSAASAVPADLRLAVLWLAAWWYETRTPVNVGNIVNPLPHHLDALIDAHRVAFIA